MNISTGQLNLSMSITFRLIAIISLMGLSQVVDAANLAGKVVFSIGEVSALSVSGKARRLHKGDKVFSGETVVTQKSSLIQLRMIDKGFISVRSRSKFKIEKFKLGKSKEQDLGIFRLIKGGFRAITGIVGKRKRASYRVNTVTATIGIRGTDYTARICDNDCGDALGGAENRGDTIPNGLYVGVLNGGVVLVNGMGQLELQRLHYGFVKDASSAPQALLNAPKFIFFKSSLPKLKDSDDDSSDQNNITKTSNRSVQQPSNGDVFTEAKQSSDLNSDDGTLNQEKIDQEQVLSLDAEDGTSFNDPSQLATQTIAMATGPIGNLNRLNNVTANSEDALTFDSNGFVEGFSATAATAEQVQYKIGTAKNVDLGRDANTGFRWGRWSAGVATVGNENLDLNNSSLHWVAGPSVIDKVALPSGGSVSYTLVGNTNPTDNLGNEGVLGSATLDANFSSMTVDASVDLSINNQVWSASGAGLPINASAQYMGNLSVNGNDSNQGAFTGTGSVSGVFSNNGAGLGMTYSLDANVNNVNTTVSGAAVFSQ